MRTYGNAKLLPGKAGVGIWELLLEPHVALRIKRIFGRARKQVGTLRIADTLEVRRDLEWVCDRYPLVLSEQDRERLTNGAAEFTARAERVQGLLAGDYTPAAFDLALPPRDYQRAAADIALRMGGLLVADDVGLGKTITGICVVSDPRARPALVVTLTHLPTQWAREIQRFAPTLRVHVLKKGTPYDLRVAPSFGSRQRRRPDSQATLPIAGVNDFPDVIVTNYHKLAGWAETLAGVVKGVVFDEAQELRLSTSEKYKAAELIAQRAHYRLGLTATPVYNYGGEIHSVLECIAPGALGTKTEFTTEWCTDAGNDRFSVKDPRAFGCYVREVGVMIRRTRTDVGRELPALTKVAHHVETDRDPLASVDRDVAELARFILARSGSNFDLMKASGELDWRLRQATGIAKAPHIAEFVNLLVEGGEKVVVYAWHKAVYEILRTKLAAHAPQFFTGDESGPQKQASLDAFTKGESKVLVMSLRAGAGVDGLQHACRTVVFGELDWSPGVHEQAIGRVFRDGQKEPVLAYFLLADSGSDPVIADVLGIKTAQVEGIRNPTNEELLEKLDVSGEHVKKLAAAVLAARGEKTSEFAPAQEGAT